MIHPLDPMPHFPDIDEVGVATDGIRQFLNGIYGPVVVDTVGVPDISAYRLNDDTVVIDNISGLHETMTRMAVEKENRRIRLEEMDRVINDQVNWRICKRRGNRIRWQHKLTGEYDPSWYPMFVTVPSSVNVIGLNSEEFNDLSRRKGFPPR